MSGRLPTAAALALAAALQGCGGTAPPEAPPEACSVADQRQSMDAWLGSQYLWYQQLRGPDASAETMDGYFRSRLWSLDRYSYTQSTASFQQTFSFGVRYGWGYALVWADAARTQLRVRNVEPASPVAAAGVRRGDIVLAIDGLTPAQVMAGGLPAADGAGILRAFSLQDPATGAVREVSVASALFMLKPMAAVTVLEGSRAGRPQKVGYMAYHQFAGYSGADLRRGIQQLVDAGVRDLVLDLRYNGGGSVGVARDLASLIGGSTTDGKVFATLRFNELQRAQDQEYLFTTPAARTSPALKGLDRVVVITSGGTASASELLINGLRPYMQVILVGDATYGKPYGFLPRSYCEVTYNAVNFDAVNALGVGGFTRGFAPDCSAPDDLDHPLGDPAERRTQAALAYLATGSCGPQARALAAASAGAGAGAGAGERPAVGGETTPPGMFP